MDYQTFKTRKEAQAEIDKMSGWDAKPAQLYIPDDENANKNGNVFVIACKISKSVTYYMRKDGYVR